MAKSDVKDLVEALERLLDEPCCCSHGDCCGEHSKDCSIPFAHAVIARVSL